MAQPASKADLLAAEAEQWQPLSPFRARQIIAECKALLKSVSPELASKLYLAIGLASMRAQLFSKAADAFRTAGRLGLEPELVAINLSAALLANQEYVEGINEIAAIADDSRGSRRVLAYANLAEGLARLGQMDDALASFRVAVEAADVDSPAQMFGLAMQAAEIGANDEALKFFVRFVTVGRRRKIERTEDLSWALRDADLRSLLEERPALLRVVELALHPPSLPPPVEVDDGSEPTSAERVYDETLALRQRANHAVLGEGG